MKLLKSTDNIVKGYYVKISKYILYEKEFVDLSIGAKMLYIYLTDRWTLSKINNFINNNGEVYILFKQEKLCKLMNVSAKTIIKYFSELKKFNLIHIAKVKNGLPNKIYLTNLIESMYVKKLHTSHVKSTNTHIENLHTNNNIINKTYISKNNNQYSNIKSIYNNFTEQDWNKLYCN